MTCKEKIIKRSKAKCELCEEPIAYIWSLLRKGAPQDSDPAYSALGLCENCAQKLKDGKYVKTSKAIKLIIKKIPGSNKDNITVMEGLVSDKKIKERFGNNIDIVGPIYKTDIISKQKISYYLSQR